MSNMLLAVNAENWGWNDTWALVGICFCIVLLIMAFFVCRLCSNRCRSALVFRRRTRQRIQCINNQECITGLFPVVK